MNNLWVLFKSLGFAVCGMTAFSINCAIAQITQDGTLTTNSKVTSQGNMTNIEGGTRVGNNLFHSFEQFSVPPGITAHFQNPKDIQNIISRVTGKSISSIDGILKADGIANVFLINPNGIIFGPNASLDISGSFVASTASSLNFADGTKFSAIDPRTTPMLTVSVPTGLQFGTTAAFIRNQSQARPNGVTSVFNQSVGLQVQADKTLALVGGEITLEDGNLTAASGRIELGSVAGNSLVKLNPTNQGWVLGYEDVQNFQNIRLIQRNDDSEIGSIIDGSSKDRGGSIRVQGDSVELIGPGVRLRSQTMGVEDGGDLTITARKLIIQDGAQVSTATLSEGNGGNLTVNASESVEVIGSFASSKTKQPSILSTSTGAAGKAGDMTLNTGRLLIQDGASVTTESNGLLVDSEGLKLLPATGEGGNLTVNASESVALLGTSKSGHPSSLIALTNSFGDAGKVRITRGKLIVQDQAAIAVNSEFSTFTYLGALPNLGKSGDLNVMARSILLDNGGKLTSNSESGQGGDIRLQVWDLLGLGIRRNSQITTNAEGKGNGGNISIYVPNGFIFAVPSENSDISANAVGGNGGNVKINALGLIGIQYREKPTNYSDITASSEFGLNGKVQINSPDADPSRGLVELPVNLVDASQQIVADCNSRTKIARSSFIRTGRGGLIADPTQPLIADDAVLADWITLSPESQNRAGGIPKRAVVQAQQNTEKKSPKVNSVNEPTQIVEAQGWVIDANGNVVLVAQIPTATPHNSWLNTASCAAK
ncbi:filamentous hemagglutinin N-terminal domain-containing protein [Nostoc sp.]|uniref:filamentous hemagglutinin N-terminal domain-containing protein n=1 Tax=Nostoc sp. TaxID=1180 RepID=UPI002FF70546